MKFLALHLILLISFLFSWKPANAQDTIVYKNGDVGIVKIVETTPEKVRFKYLNESNGPIYFVAMSYVMKIKSYSGVATSSNTNTTSNYSAPRKGNANMQTMFTEEAKGHNPLYQVVIGGAYQTGTSGVDKDEVEALRWFHKAADQGDALGQANVGMFYEFGFGVAKDKQEALKWYRMVLAQGETNAKGIAEGGVQRLTR